AALESAQRTKRRTTDSDIMTLFSTARLCPDYSAFIATLSTMVGQGVIPMPHSVPENWNTAQLVGRTRRPRGSPWSRFSFRSQQLRTFPIYAGVRSREAMWH